MADILKEDVNMPQKIREARKKQGRRGNNEGSIYQRKQDGRWCGSVTTGCKTDGKPIRKTVYGSSRQEVAKKIAAMTVKVFTDGYTTLSARAEHNFKILCEEWFDLVEAPGLASITVANRRSLLRTHIIKEFGTYDLQQIDSTMIQRFFNSKSQGHAADTVRKLKGLLANFFKYAVKKHYIATNPMSDVVVKYPKSNKASTAKPLSKDLRLQVFQEVTANPVLHPILVTFALTGLRPQELIVLTWDNVDLSNRILSVKCALNRTVEFDEDGNTVSKGVKIGDTKTKYSIRTILLPQAVVTALIEWQTYCKNNSIVSEYVFPSTDKKVKGKMRTYAGLRSLLNRFISSHGLQNERISLYTFRHTFATVLLEARENPKIVAALMGHAKASTTMNIYQHVVSSDIYEETAATLDGVYSKICLNA